MSNLYSLFKTFVKRFLIFYVLYSAFSYGAHWFMGTDFSVSKCLNMAAMISILTIIYEFVAPRFAKE
jgi:hypothetical protein